METESSAFWQFINDNTGIIASFAGSLTSAYFSEKLTWRERVVSFFLGGVAAIALADPVNSYLHLGEKATCYLMGFFGLNLCAAVLKGVRRFGDDADFWTLFRDFVIRFIDRAAPEQKAKETETKE